MTSDPIGLAGGLNTYGYVGGDPVDHFDLFGLRGSPYGAGGGGSAIGNDEYYGHAQGPSRFTGLPDSMRAPKLTQEDLSFRECQLKCINAALPPWLSIEGSLIAGGLSEGVRAANAPKALVKGSRVVTIATTLITSDAYLQCTMGCLLLKGQGGNCSIPEN